MNRELAAFTMVLLYIEFNNTFGGWGLERLSYSYKVKYLRKLLDICHLEIALHAFYLSIVKSYYPNTDSQLMLDFYNIFNNFYGLCWILNWSSSKEILSSTSITLFLYCLVQTHTHTYTHIKIHMFTHTWTTVLYFPPIEF